MFGSFGWMELLLILIIVLIIFGAGKIPQLGEGLGKAIKGFKKSVNEADAVDVTPTQEQAAQPQQIPQVGQPQPGTQQTQAQPQAAPVDQPKHG
jgi:sec-independent protein translocase protein TatA